MPISGNPAAFTPYAQGIIWIGDNTVSWRDFWAIRLSGAEASGVYYVVAAWTRPDSLSDGRIDQGDVLAFDWKAFHIQGSPP